MELLFLGTGAGVPARTRNVSSLALKLLDEINETWLFDCGEGTQQQIIKTTLKPRKITTIFITHMHGDHIFGLPGLLSSRSFQGGEDLLTIYGPPGIKQYITMSLKLSKTHLSYPLRIMELDPAGGDIKLANQWEIRYLPLDHNILSFGYRITEPDRPGELLINKLNPFNIKNGPIFGQLKRGETVVLEDGTVLDGKDYIAPDYEGRVVTILGDSRQCDNIMTLAQDADVLVHEATHSIDDAEMARRYFHSTNAQAAEVARQSNVGHLYMNHISARYMGDLARKLEADARAIFPQAKLVYDFDEFRH